MKKRFHILNSFLVLAVLFAMLFQSVHSYEHFEAELSQKKCHHKSTSKQQITHQHHNFDHCFVCDFKMSSFVSSDILYFEFQNTIIPSGYTFFESREITQFFKGSLFALRAPPVFIA
ncbi:MAG: hypothetical protein V4572_03555 [Bacteroidota bacterium]